jgi:hypothetical protein
MIKKTEIMNQLCKVQVKKGDTLVIYVPPNIGLEEQYVLQSQIQEFSEMKSRENKDAAIFVFRGDSGIQVLDEKDMNKFGWYRKDKQQDFNKKYPGLRKVF